MASPKTDFAFTHHLDLTDEQVYITKETYQLHAKDYVLRFERNLDISEAVIPRILDPFLDLTRLAGFNNSPVLIAGCGSGRDAHHCYKSGFKAIGIDTSTALLQIGKELKVRAKLKVMDINSLNFKQNTFGGIYCDSALSHVKKSQIPNILKSFHQVTKKGGILLIGLRQGDGHVYYTQDDLGARRYYNTHNLEAATSLVATCGFQLVRHLVSPHSIKNRPKWLYLYLKSI